MSGSALGQAMAAFGALEEVAAGSIEVDAAGVTLPAVRAVLFKLDNWYVLPEDMATENIADVVYGYHGTYAHMLRAGGNTELLPVPNSNLQNVCLRTAPGQPTTIFYSYYRPKNFSK